jgi:hypothetical protein
MIKIKVNLDLKKALEKTLNARKEKKLESIVSALKGATPVDTGNARDHWKVEGNSIINEVEYVEYLNEGSSQQAPVNFIESTLLAQEGVIPSGTIVRLK